MTSNGRRESAGSRALANRSLDRALSPVRLTVFSAFDKTARSAIAARLLARASGIYEVGAETVLRLWSAAKLLLIPV
jgi:hypothetical protein